MFVWRRSCPDVSSSGLVTTATVHSLLDLILHFAYKLCSCSILKKIPTNEGIFGDLNCFKKEDMEKAIIDRIKHIETFYEQAPPGIVKEYEEKPEECIPDTEGNRKAREFLANAPKKGLWMPLGQEVKVMQCWKCKNYGHRTGDRECPLFESGNASSEKFREMYEDPMYSILNSKSRQDQSKKLQWLQQVLDDSSTDSSSSDENHKRSKKKKKKLKSKEQWVEKTVENAKKSSKSKKRKSEKVSKKLHKERKRNLSNDDNDVDKKHKKVKSLAKHKKSGEHSRRELHDDSVERHHLHKHKKEKKLKRHDR